MSARFRTGTGSKRKRRSSTAAQYAAAVVEGTAAPGPTPVDISLFSLEPESKLPKRRRQPGEVKLSKRLRNGGALHLPGGERLVQRPHLPPSAIPGQTATQALFASSSRRVTFALEDLSDNEGHDGPELTWDEQHRFYVCTPGESNASRHRRRRIAQHVNWRDVMSEKLVLAYLAFKNNVPSDDKTVCTCMQRRRLDVSYMDLEDGPRAGQLYICPCVGAVQQLVAQGYFPCAPKAPSMAFSFALLDLISIHTLHVAPNVTAWSETLERFWARGAASTRATGRLRKRLGMALTWFQVLQNQAQNLVDAKVDESERVRTATNDQATIRPGDDETVDFRTRNHQDGADETPPVPSGGASEPGERLTRPTPDLRRKCQLCFGGPRPQLSHSLAHVIVCLDANFAQKRRKCAEGDAPLEFLPTRFLSSTESAAMEEELAQKRSAPPKRRRPTSHLPVDDDVLDECEQSFIAAQEKVTKASKNYYADTGLMALTCPHDRVLWVVNMTSPGERQHYALALLRKLAEHLPGDWRIGLLYDIACQLAQSIQKWGLLPELADRLIYGVSVFHAYGHQWACQIVFHPRKRVGFGLSDGEGCERFWSAIRHLIPGLRVSGFYRRQFILDRQMSALNDAALWKAATWLRKKHGEAVRRLADAQIALAACGVPESELRAEWAAQVEAQLKKPARQSVNAADKTIDEILVLLGLIGDFKQQMRDDRAKLRKAHAMTSPERQKLSASIDAAARDIEATESRMAALHATLGTERTRRLETLRGDAYIRTRVRARALRAAIRDNLVHHKFEHRKLERAFRHQVLQAKEHTQTKDLVHRRERTIGTQVRSFNKLVDEMALLAKQGKKPAGRAPLPRKMDVKKLFKLDVDDDIWQEDPGLGPQGEDNLPRWQTDDSVKRGILAVLQADRCHEELERLDCQLRALASWWKERFDAMNDLVDGNDALGERNAVPLLLVNSWLVDEGSPVLRAAIQRLVDQHQALRNTWLGDLKLGPLGLQFSSLLRHVATESARDGFDSSTAVGSEPDTERQPEKPGDVDSDDASDAYTEPFDQDEPIAEMLDELDNDAGLADIEDDAQDEPADEAVAQSPDPRAASTAEQVAEIPPNVTATVQQQRRKHTHIVYRAGTFICRDEDVELLARPRAWLSGDGLSVFLEHSLLASAVQGVSVMHSRLLWDVDYYLKSLATDAEARIAANKNEIWKALDKAVHPSTARKWLILGHVPTLPHWTLLEVRWPERTILFYDSYAATDGYADDLRDSVRTLLDLCSEYFGLPEKGADYTWVGESRDMRQDNSWDCGPFAAADAVSLMESDSPSTMVQDEMVAWRRTMEAAVRALRVEESSASSSEGVVVAYIEIDSD